MRARRAGWRSRRFKTTYAVVLNHLGAAVARAKIETVESRVIQGI
jgi:hypothetical protein